MDKSYNPDQVEDKWYKYWEDNECFFADPSSKKEPFSVIMPPPNVTGILHMGHALVNTLQDVQIRFKRMQGYEALWMPGTDHAGISTQTVVEKHLIKTLGKRRTDFSREEFLEKIWEFKQDNEEKILNQLKKIGCSCDWSKLRFTMDKTSSRAVKSMFKKLFDQGLIYRGDYLVNWDTLTQTALSDDEVEYEEVDSFLWTLLYPLENGKGHIRIATTRPETMLGDVAIAVNPKDLRYKDLIGTNAILPFLDRKLPIIADPFVDKDFGTGAVKITPAHDPNDYEMGLRHNLEQINIMTPDGRINENGKGFTGLTMKEARQNVLLKLEEKGLLEKKEPHTHRVGKSYRSKAVIEPYLSKQWFVKMTDFKEKLMTLVQEDKVQMLPEHWKNTYFHWIENLRDWCISRQLWWGHQIPVWHNKNDPEKIICCIDDNLPEEIKNNPNDWEQSKDVLDTWFSSALWPFSTLGWPENTPELEKFYPTTLLITGHDILFFWVARMIMMGSYAIDEVPFKKTFLHGLIYGKSYWTEDSDGNIHYVETSDKVQYDLGKPIPKNVHSKWEKMSKSKKNVIDPIEICEEYGTDAMRLALCSSATHARQIDLDRRRFDDYKNFANKVWNGARFVFMNIEDLESEDFSKGLELDLLTLEDKWITSLLNRVIEKMNFHLENLQFDKAATCAYDFFWKEFCAYYVELCKPYLFDTEHPLRKNKQKLLVIVLSNVLALMHPIAPFVTEEIFSHLKKLFKGEKPSGMIDPYTEKTLSLLSSKALITASYPSVIKKEDISKKIEEKFAFVDQIIYQIRNIRGQMQIPLGEKTDLYLSSTRDNPFLKIARENTSAILSLTKTSNVHFEEIPEKSSFGASAVLEKITLFIPLPKHLQEKEIVRLKKEQEKLVTKNTSLEKRLSLSDFVDKAPVEVVDKLRHTLEENRRAEFEIKQKLKSLQD